MTLLLIAIGAAVGAPLRYLTDRFIQSRHDSVFPWGTWTVNVAGSFVLGALAAAVSRGAVGPGLMAALGTGFCGALTTYSTFGYETVRLVESGAYRHAALNIAGTIAAGLAAATLGAFVVG